MKSGESVETDSPPEDYLQGEEQASSNVCVNSADEFRPLVGEDFLRLGDLLL